MPDGTSKPGIFFKDRRAGLILNRTNSTVLASLFGDETDEWGGKWIELRTEKVNFQGAMVDGVRVAAATHVDQKAKAAPAPAAAPAPQFIEEDDVPF